MIVKETILKNINSQQYLVEIAHTQNEIDEALRLRFDVFGKELNRNFSFTGSKDHDIYDDQSHHLIVRHNDSGSVIGTYRLQTMEMANIAKGFYTQKRFYIEQLPTDVLENAVEVGRACIHPDHRNGRVLFLLWKGLAGYLEYFKKRYLFGYSALDTTDPEIAMNTYRYLCDNGHHHGAYSVGVKEPYQINSISSNGDGETDIPSLLRNYLQVGTKVCSMPAHDVELNIIHIMILLDIENISDRTRKLFFGS